MPRHTTPPEDVDLTDTNQPIDVYDAIARRFFAEFLALKVDINLGRAVKPVNYERELGQHKRAAEAFKKAAADMAEENRRLEEALVLAEEKIAREREKLNEALVALHAAKEKLSGLGLMRDKQKETGYAFEEHLDAESRKVWQALMRAPGSNKE